MARSSEAGNVRTIGSRVPAAGSVIFQDRMSRRASIGGPTSKDLRNDSSMRGWPSAVGQLPLTTSVYFLPLTRIGPSSSRGFSPFFTRPGSSRRVIRVPSGFQSSSPISRNGKSSFFPVGSTNETR